MKVEAALSLDKTKVLGIPFLATFLRRLLAANAFLMSFCVFSGLVTAGTPGHDLEWAERVYTTVFTHIFSVDL